MGVGVWGLGYEGWGIISPSTRVRVRVRDPHQQPTLHMQCKSLSLLVLGALVL